MQAYSNELYHYGVIGMKWGVRRYQNPDGSLKSAGRKRYNSDQEGNRKNKLTDEQKSKLKKAAIIGASVAAVGLAAYGAHKLDVKLSSELSARSVADGKKAISKAFEASKLASNAGNFADNARKYSDKELSKAMIDHFSNSAKRYDSISENLYNKGFDLIKKGKEGNFTTKEKADLLKEWLRNRNNSSYSTNSLRDLFD